MSGPVEQSAVTDTPGATIDPALTTVNGIVTVFVRLGRANTDVTASRQATIKTLKRHAQRTQQPVLQFAKRQPAGITVLNQFWITNAALVRVDTTEVSLKKLAAIQGVRRVAPNPTLTIPQPVNESAGTDGGDGRLSTTASATVAADEYNTTYGVDQINATEVWSEYGTMGEGVKVAVLDTGVDIDHPDIDLFSRDETDETYPGGWAEFTASGERVQGSVPHDTGSHGTHTSGTVSGGNAGTDTSATPGNIYETIGVSASNESLGIGEPGRHRGGKGANESVCIDEHVARTRAQSCPRRSSRETVSVCAFRVLTGSFC